VVVWFYRQMSAKNPPTGVLLVSPWSTWFTTLYDTEYLVVAHAAGRWNSSSLVVERRGNVDGTAAKKQKKKIPAHRQTRARCRWCNAVPLSKHNETRPSGRQFGQANRPENDDSMPNTQ